MRGRDATWVGFLAACFVVVGLAGVFATFAVPLPYERALLQLGISTDVPGGPQGQRSPRLAPTCAEAEKLLRDAATEAQGIALRTRILLCVLTVMAAVFGAVVFRAGGRASGERVSGGPP